MESSGVRRAEAAYNPPSVDERRPIPESIQHRADVDALLASATNYEERLPRDPLRKALDLGRVRRLLGAVGDPQRSARTVHVAGSKGKGTTARMIAAGLRHAGRGPVGLYTSPHLEDLTERIQIDGSDLSEGPLARAADRVLPHVRRVQGTPDAPTFFEIFTAIAWVAFREAGCTDVVLETGLGGRLDATTVCDPAVTVITTIEREHTRLLGETVEEIAAEKAGILKPGVPAVTSAQGAAQRVIGARAKALGAPLDAIGASFDIAEIRSAPGPTLTFEMRAGGATAVSLPLAGAHNAENAAAAWLALQHLGLDADDAWAGIGTVRLPGLLEVVARDPLVVIDGAHTARSAEAARAAVDACWPDRRVVVVLAALDEKDLGGIARGLGRDAAAVVATSVHSPRAVDFEVLAAAVRDQLDDTPILAEPTAARALEIARARAGPEGLVLCAGSVYLAGEIRTLTRAEEE